MIDKNKELAEKIVKELDKLHNKATVCDQLRHDFTQVKIQLVFNCLEEKDKVKYPSLVTGIDC